MLETKPQWYVEQIRNIHRKLTKKVKFITAPLEKTIVEYQKERYYENVEWIEIANALPMLSEEKRKETLEYKLNRIKNSDKISFLIISRLMPFKGIELALKSFMSIENDNIVLNIAGDGLLANFVKECAKKDKRIIYHGYLIGDKKEEIFKNTDVLVFPTTELETFGLVILEAYNNSMPVITSAVEATKRLVDNNTGIVIDDINYEKLTKAIEEYTNKNKLIKQMENTFQKVNTFDYDKFICEYEKIYKKILEE